MGSKRKRNKQGPASSSVRDNGKVWPDQTVDELLSYLHSQVAFLDPATEISKDRDFDDVDEELARHINLWRRDRTQDAPEQLREFTAKQVRVKLSRLSAGRTRSENDDDDSTVIYTLGFACLDWTDDRERQARMTHRSKEIKHNWKYEFLHSPRKTRAHSEVNSSLGRDIRASSSVSYSRPRVARSTTTRSQTQMQNHASDSVTHDSTIDTESSTNGDSGDVFIKTENLIPKSSFLMVPGSDGSRPSRLSLRAPEELSDSEPESFGTPLSTLTSLSPASHCSVSSDNEREQLPSIRILKQRLRAVEKELEIVKSRSGLEIDYWKARYSKEQEESLKWKKSKNFLASELTLLRSTVDGDLASEELVDYKALLDDLLNEQTSLERIQDVSSDTEAELDGETFSKVNKAMQGIGDRLRSTLRGARFLPVPDLRVLAPDHPLRPLIEQAFGVHSDSQEVVDLLERWREQPILQEYGLLALCGAALACWIFQQTQADILFDRYQDAATRSSTNRYRDAIRLVAQSDPALASAVDLTVHQDLAKEDIFQHFQQVKGQDLAHRFSEALAPLFKLDPNEEDVSDDDLPAETYSIDQISTAFVHAIDVHCRLVLTGRRYECAWYEPGEHFNSANMSLLHNQDMGATALSRIGWTLLPGINRITASRMCVDFGGFIERRPRHHEEAVCLVPAVVVPDLH